LKVCHTNNTSLRIPELDGIRGIAIIMVLVWHYIACQEKILVQGTFLSMLHFPTKYFGLELTYFLFYPDF
jgi:peptidoglycan/LPS O-acetylase OafA/YrhL